VQQRQRPRTIFHNDTTTRPPNMDRAQTITEDTLYRSSTQYQRWSFTPSQLAHQRQTTNIQASARVRAAVQRQRAQRALDPVNTSEGSGVENGGNTTGGNTPIPVERADREVNCLTAAEEKRLVDTFCERALELGNFLQFPIEVTVCAPTPSSHLHTPFKPVLYRMIYILTFFD
jgi:hypothetical protein